MKRWEGSGRTLERGNYNQNIMYEKFFSEKQGGERLKKTSDLDL